MRRLKQSHPNIKFIHETNKEDIAFLDLKVKLLDGKISTYQFLKSTDGHQFLHYTSLHPEHTKRSIVFSQTPRVSRICFYESNFVRHLGNMKLWFSEKGYPSDLVESKTKKVKLIPILTIGTEVNLLKGSHLYWLITLRLSCWLRFILKNFTFYIWTKKWKS